MKRCTKCVLGPHFPGIIFGEDGVCSICQEFSERQKTVASPRDFGGILSKIIDASKSKGPRYDAVVSCSGGKDSTFLLHLLQEKYHLRLLAVTFDNGFLSEACSANLRIVTARLNVDHIIIRYRQDRLNEIFLASGQSPLYPEHLTKFGSGVCISCIRMVMTAALRTAIEKQVPMVMLGNSPGQVMRSPDELIYQDNRIPYALRRQLFDKLADRTGPWVYDYLMLTAEEHRTRPFPYVVSPLPVLGYDETKIYRTIAGLGWSKPKDVDPNSTNCRLNAFGIVKHQNLHQFHPYEYEMGQLVRQGLISRDAALERLADHDGKGMAIAAQVERDLLGAAGGAQWGGR
jgi:hypothetical protein